MSQITPEKMFEGIQSRVEEIIDEARSHYDVPTLEKHGAVVKDNYYAFPAAALCLLIQEFAKNNEDKETPFVSADLAQAVLALLLRKHTGIDGSLANRLILMGMFNSVEQLHQTLSYKGLAEIRRDIYDFILPKIESEQTHSVPILGIVGLIGSGKGTAGKILAEKLDGQNYALSNVLRWASIALGDTVFDRDTLRSIDQILKPKYGNDIFVRWTLSMALNKILISPKITDAKAGAVIIDGFRTVGDLASFPGKLLFIDTDTEIRWQRVQERARSGEVLNREDFDTKDQREAAGIMPIRRQADFVINNNGDQADLEAQLDKIIEALDEI